jgi:hypothetical protein
MGDKGYKGKGREVAGDEEGVAARVRVGGGRASERKRARIF